MNPIHRYPALRKASLKSLQAFESAYLHKNFATAAVELSVTASAVSHAIQSLEELLGTQLFDRSKRGVTPTDAGGRLYEALRRSFVEIDAELLAIVERSSRVQMVTIQSAPSFAAIWIVPRLPAFLQAHPEIDVRLWAVHESADFSNNGLDMAVVYGRPPPSPSVTVESLCHSDTYVPMCSPKLVAKRSLPLKPTALREMALIHSDMSLVRWPDWANRYMPDVGNVERGLHLDRSFMTLNAAMEGLGVCLDSTFLAHEYIQKKKLIMPFGELGIAADALHLCIPKNKLKMEKVRVVAGWIKSWLPTAEVGKRRTS